MKEKKNRLNRMMIKMKDGEVDVTLKMKEYLRSTDGKFQIKEMVSTCRSEFSNSEDARRYCQQVLIKRAIKAHHSVQRHNFNARIPSLPIYCANPQCQGSFTSLDQYKIHFEETKLHTLSDSPQFASFHYMLRDIIGYDCVLSFVKKKGDVYITNCFEFIRMMISFRRQITGTVAYKEHVKNIYEMFMMDCCTHPLYNNLNKRKGISRMKTILYDAVTGSQRNDPIKSIVINMKKKVETLIFSDLDFEEEFFQPVQGSSIGSWYFNFLKASHRTYFTWTDECIFLPNDFDLLEYEVFLKVYKYICLDDKERTDEFYRGSGYGIYQDHLLALEFEKDNKMKNSFVVYRKIKFREWTRQFVLNDGAITDKAMEVVNKLREDAMNLWIEEEIFCVAIKDEITRRRVDEQENFENLNMKIDEAISWIVMNLWDELFIYTVPPLIDSLLVDNVKHPYIRSDLLRYAGVITLPGGGGSLMTNLGRKNNAKELFDDLFGK